MVGKITDCPDSFEKLLNSVNNSNSNPPPPTKSWASVTKKGLPNHYVIPRPIGFSNEFKPAFFTIRKSVPSSHLFQNKSPLEIVKIVKYTLGSINAKTADDSPVTVKGVTSLPSGDFCFYTQSRFRSNWLWEPKHEWTPLCDPALITPPSLYQAILHSVHIPFTLNNRATIAELSRENSINPTVVSSTRWLGYPLENKQSHSSNVLNIKDKNLARINSLNNWFNIHNDRRIPTFILMDSNLHHKLWNPSNYRHVFLQAKNLIKSCGKNRIQIMLEKGVPTFARKNLSSTCIDLTWANHQATKFVNTSFTSSENFSSDHQSIHLNLDLYPNSRPPNCLSFDKKNLNFNKFNLDLSKLIAPLIDNYLNNHKNIDTFVDVLTCSFQKSIENQKKKSSITSPRLNRGGTRRFYLQSSKREIKL
ncbi:hypothetical protein MJO29_008096, partial [Puccinia striiformis f. sp. tritici]